MTKTEAPLGKIANIVRGLSVSAVERAGSGHNGLPLGGAELGTTIFFELLKHNPAQPTWADRDRFVLSAGHGSAMLYSLLHLSGYDVTEADMRAFRQVGSRTPGHPEYGHTAGVETTTGPLGQGLGNAVGLAIAERRMRERFATPEFSPVDHYTYVLVGDGDLMEGLSAEVAALAGHLRLGRLIVFYDYNKITIDGPLSLASSEDPAQRFKAHGWQVLECDAHDPDSIIRASGQARADQSRPSFIIATSTIGKGAPNFEGSHKAHGGPYGKDELALIHQALGTAGCEDFSISGAVTDFCTLKRNEWNTAWQEWNERLETYKTANPQKHAEYARWMQRWNTPALPEETRDGTATDAELSTRVAGGHSAAHYATALPWLIGGSADLSAPCFGSIDAFDPVTPDSFAGNYIHYGVREHGMAAVANGIALHGGQRPFISTFLAFSDYMRPAIRLAALMKLPVIYVFTHDSVFIGQDGPTHQPVEHLASLRAIPGLAILRPADAEETEEAWQIALGNVGGPTALVLTRQNVANLQKHDPQWRTNIRTGGYMVYAPTGVETPQQAEALIAASGSDVALAVEAASNMTATRTAVISLLSQELLEAAGRPGDADRPSGTTNPLGDADRRRLLPPDIPTLFVEAGRYHGWASLLMDRDRVLAIDEFGRSGPGEEVAKALGFTAEAVRARVEQLVASRQKTGSPA